MDEKSLQMLEFPKIREMLAGYTAFPVSRELAITLKPSSDTAIVFALLRQSAESRHLLSMVPNFSIGEAVDIREDVAIAARGKILNPQTLLDIQSTLAAANHLRNSIEEMRAELPSLWIIAKQIIALPYLEQEIARCIDVTGEILDSASPELTEIRRQLKETRRQLLRRLETLMRSLHEQNLLQEAIITDRGGRYVLPVKVESQHEVKGIVHDTSNTGATVFVEPWENIDMGNKLKQLALEEEREIQRILAHLCSETGENKDIISRNLELMAELDLAIAKARYARTTSSIEPLISSMDGNSKSELGVLKLIEARHPLLREKAVPISVEVGGDFPGLVITGPNTGGKTVTLKTVGLLALMAQSGMPIPASAASCLPVFDGIFADIGDEQSIEQTLSTFSWHMSNIARIIRVSTKRSLVLLDELGGSTDPAEGAALARAILLHFLSQKTCVIATTHYSELKVFAHSVPSLQNASLEFDPVTLTPTYHLTLGIPGGSNALAIASQLGLPEQIIDSAKKMLPKGTQEIENMLTDLSEEKQAIQALRVELEKEKGKAEDNRRQIESALQNMRLQEQRVRQETMESIAIEAAKLQKQIRQASSELKRSKSKEHIQSAKEKLNLVRKQLSDHLWQPEISYPKTGRDAAEGSNISVGDAVRVIETSLKGTVLSISEKSNQVEIQAGRTRIKISREDIEKIEPFEEKAPYRSFKMEQSPGQRRRSLELDLRGKRAEEIETELDSYLNDVSLAGFSQVRIIHGYGTGTVRQIVRNMLVSYPLVKSFRPGEQGEGGDGVTIVQL